MFHTWELLLLWWCGLPAKENYQKTKTAIKSWDLEGVKIDKNWIIVTPHPPKKKEKVLRNQNDKTLLSAGRYEISSTAFTGYYTRMFNFFFFLLTFFRGSVHTHDCFSFGLHICCWGLYIVHCWSILPSPPACFYSRQMIIYLIWPIIVITLRTWKSKLVWMHIHWPVHIFLRKEHRYFE